MLFAKGEIYYWYVPSPISKEQKKILKTIGERFRAARKSKGLTLKQLSFEIDKDWQSIQRLETGNVNPSLIFLVEVAAGLDTDLSVIFHDLK